jgi:hypothetical protein
VSLTELEKKAGTIFRDSMVARLTAAITPASPCDPHIREYRHDCAARGGTSWPLRLKEHTEVSPEYWVCACGKVEPKGEFRVFPHDDCDGGRLAVPAGRFTFTWLDGHCKCGIVVRSSSGRFEVCD